MPSENYTALISAFEQPLNLPEHSVEQVRTVMKPLHGAPLADDSTLEYCEFGGVRCAWVAAAGQQKSERVCLFFHGGGFVSCPLDDYLFYAEIISRELRCRVLTADYRLAPEAPFPSAEIDCLAVYKAVICEVPSVFVMGDSCGGYLGLKTLIAARDEKWRMADCFVGFSGWYDLRDAVVDRSDYLPDKDVFITDRWHKNRIKDYLGDHSGLAGSLSPVNLSLNGLPPLFLSAGSNDLTVGDALALAARADIESVRVEMDVAQGLCHGYQGLIGAEIPEAKAVWRRAADFVKKTFARIDSA